MSQNKSQKFKGLTSKPERVGNFNNGEVIKGSITFLGMAPIVDSSVISVLEVKPEPNYDFTGKVVKINDEGYVVEIQVTQCVGILEPDTLLDITSGSVRYSFQSIM